MGWLTKETLECAGHHHFGAHWFFIVTGERKGRAIRQDCLLYNNTSWSVFNGLGGSVSSRSLLSSLGYKDGDDGPNNSESRAYEVMME